MVWIPRPDQGMLRELCRLWQAQALPVQVPAVVTGVLQLPHSWTAHKAREEVGLTGGQRALDVGSCEPRPGVAVDMEGNVFIADTGERRVRIVTPSGTVSASSR